MSLADSMIAPIQIFDLWGEADLGTVTGSLRTPKVVSYLLMAREYYRKMASLLGGMYIFGRQSDNFGQSRLVYAYIKKQLRTHVSPTLLEQHTGEIS